MAMYFESSKYLFICVQIQDAYILAYRQHTNQSHKSPSDMTASLIPEVLTSPSPTHKRSKN